MAKIIKTVLMQLVLKWVWIDPISVFQESARIFKDFRTFWMFLQLFNEGMDYMVPHVYIDLWVANKKYSRLVWILI